MNIPSQLIVLDAVGALLAGLGVAGLLTDLSEVVPFLANKDLAGVIAGVGFALMIFAVFKIVQHLRAARLQPPERQ